MSDFYIGLNPQGREFVMQALIQANQDYYKQSPQDISVAQNEADVKPAIVAVEGVQSMPDRRAVARGDLALSRKLKRLRLRAKYSLADYDHIRPLVANSYDRYTFAYVVQPCPYTKADNQ